MQRKMLIIRLSLQMMLVLGQKQKLVPPRNVMWKKTASAYNEVLLSFILLISYSIWDTGQKYFQELQHRNKGHFPQEEQKWQSASQNTVTKVMNNTLIMKVVSYHIFFQSYPVIYYSVTEKKLCHFKIVWCVWRGRNNTTVVNHIRIFTAIENKE